MRILVGPGSIAARFELHDESTRPDFVPYVGWEAPATSERLVEGLVRRVASPTGMAASWIPVEGVSDYLRAA